MDMDYCYYKMSDGDFELRNHRPSLRNGWGDAHAVETLRMSFLHTDLILIEVLSKIFFVVYSSHQR